MVATISNQCRTCITLLNTIVSGFSGSDGHSDKAQQNRANDELARFSLWAGNIGSLHPPESSLSLESRLYAAGDVLAHIRELLDDLVEAARDRRSAYSNLAVHSLK